MPKSTNIISGDLYEFSEMGGRGSPVWCVKDGDSLYPIKTGDVLTVFNNAAKKDILWESEVTLVNNGKDWPGNADSQSGMPIETWRDMFSAKRQATLQTGDKREKLIF